jgi:predicted nucleic acid-binding protein
MIAVDASVWVSGLTPRDFFHETSRHWLEVQLRQDVPLAIPVICLAEVAGAIARVTGNSANGEYAVDQILSHPNLRVLPVDQTLGIEAAQLAAQLRLRGADAVYVALARRLNIPLATWDEELLQRAGQAVTIVRPEQVAR